MRLEQHARDATMPGLEELLDQSIAATWQAAAGSDYAGEVQRTVNAVMLSRLLGLAANPDAAPQVRAVVTLRLTELRDALAAAKPTEPAQRAHLAGGARLIGQFFDDPKDFAPPRAPMPPPGQPIGTTLSCDF